VAVPLLSAAFGLGGTYSNKNAIRGNFQVAGRLRYLFRGFGGEQPLRGVEQLGRDRSAVQTTLARLPARQNETAAAGRHRTTCTRSATQWMHSFR